MRTLWQDFRYGFRMLGRSPGFTAIVVVILAVGIGATTVMLGMVALDLQVNPDLPADQIDRLLCDSGWDFQRGKLINPLGFVDAARRAGSNDLKNTGVPRAESKGQPSEGMAK